MALTTIHRGERRRASTDGILGGGILVVVVACSLAAGWWLSHEQLSSWGQWIGAFIAGIAMVASAYAIILQARHGEAASWSVALSRLGEIYDQAQQDETLARLLTERIDENGEVFLDSDDLALSPKTKVWLGSLFLAYEQVYVATLALSNESKRVWRIYLKNNLNKPTLRAAFIADASSAQDYHHAFWEFVRGSKSGDTYQGGAIDDRFFKAQDGIRREAGVKRAALHVEPLHSSHLHEWLSIYRDPEVRRQMYAAPTENEAVLEQYLRRRRFYSVLDAEGVLVGGFNFYEEEGSRACFGIVIHPAFRGQGLGREIVRLMKDEARSLGFATLRADVYADNAPCLGLLDRTGFRRFVWVETNL